MRPRQQKWMVCVMLPVWCGNVRAMYAMVSGGYPESGDGGLGIPTYNWRKLCIHRD